MLILMASLLCAFAATQGDPAREARELVERLRSDNPNERDNAVAALKKLGESARPHLERAIKDSDTEMVQRAQAILNILDSEVAREEFQKIEEAILKAKTLTVRFVSDVSGISYRTSGTMLLKDGNKAYVEATTFGNNKKAETYFASNGSTMNARSVTYKTDVPDHPGVRDEKEQRIVSHDLKSALGARLARTGLAIATLKGVVDGNITIDMETTKLCDFQRGENDGNFKRLSYKLVGEDGKPAWGVILWYNPNSYKISKRKQTWKGNGVELVLIETYEEVTLNADIDDEKFKLPAEK